MAAPPELDLERVQAFAFKVLGDVTAQQMGTLSAVADRLGLFRALADSQPTTSAEFASRAGIDERYAREWLAAMACHGYVAYDDREQRFRLPPEQATCLVDADSPFYLGSLLVTATPYREHLDRLTEAFRRGGGIPRESFGEECRCACARLGRPAFGNNLVHDLPRPRPALEAIRRALKPDGTCFVRECDLSGDLQQNIEHPLGIGAFGYSAIVNHCLTQALATGGEGIGACMGEAKLRELAEAAGFRHYRRLDFPANRFHLFCELRE